MDAQRDMAEVARLVLVDGKYMHITILLSLG